MDTPRVTLLSISADVIVLLTSNKMSNNNSFPPPDYCLHCCLAMCTLHLQYLYYTRVFNLNE